MINKRRKDGTRSDDYVWMDIYNDNGLQELSYVNSIDKLPNYGVVGIEDIEISNLVVQHTAIPILIDGKKGLITDTPHKRLPKDIFENYLSNIFILDKNSCKKILHMFFSQKENVLVFPKEMKSMEALKAILIKMENLKASDLRISSRRSTVAINYSVFGKNIQLAEDFIDMELAEKLRTTLINMSYENPSEKIIDGKFFFTLNSEIKEYRLSVLDTVAGSSIVIRSYQKFSDDLTLDNLGYTERPKEIIRNILSKPYGIFLITGPTGSGKTTTIYTIINEAFQKDKLSIKTAEDPVEIEIEGIDQCQINKKGEEKHQVTYQRLLSSFMRQKPDIIVIGEIRDKDVALSTVEAALTGHNVMSTLHTNKIDATFTRLMNNLSITSDRIEDSFSGVLSQRLVNKLCDCKIKDGDGFKANEDGCDKCSSNFKKGFDGQIPAVEVAELFKGENNYLEENFVNYYSYKDSAEELYSLGLIDKRTKTLLNSI